MKHANDAVRIAVHRGHQLGWLDNRVLATGL
jgi:hypothetical protein